jgi:NTP pyrophosphatase (non-canonical NTP hydrolase)
MTTNRDEAVHELQQLVRRFAEARDWGQFHTPRNLVLALAGEVGELAALLQWVPDDEVEKWLNDQGNLDELAAELADVFAYLLRLADVTSIDLTSALKSKVLLNESRYPRDRAKGSAEKYTNYE